MSNRTDKAEGLMDLTLDLMIAKVKSGELEKGELKVVLEFLEKQGINCIGNKNRKVRSLANELPVKVAVDNVKNLR